MSKRSTIEELSGKKGLFFYNDRYDEALLGFVESGEDVRACYCYQAIKAILNQLGVAPDALYREFSDLMCVKGSFDDTPIILNKLQVTQLWDKIQAVKTPRWDMCDKAVLGLGYETWELKGIVYDKNKCLEIIDETHKSSSDELSTKNKFNILDGITKIVLGENTPWFLTRIV